MWKAFLNTRRPKEMTVITPPTKKVEKKENGSCLDGGKQALY
jgi:hypothetical protein